MKPNTRIFSQMTSLGLIALLLTGCIQKTDSLSSIVEPTTKHSAENQTEITSDPYTDKQRVLDGALLLAECAIHTRQSTDFREMKPNLPFLLKRSDNSMRYFDAENQTAVELSEKVCVIEVASDAIEPAVDAAKKAVQTLGGEIKKEIPYSTGSMTLIVSDHKNVIYRADAAQAPLRIENLEGNPVQGIAFVLMKAPDHLQNMAN